MCVYHYTQLLYTTQHGIVRIIFPLILPQSSLLRCCLLEREGGHIIRTSGKVRINNVQLCYLTDGDTAINNYVYKLQFNKYSFWPNRQCSSNALRIPGLAVRSGPRHTVMCIQRYSTTGGFELTAQC